MPKTFDEVFKIIPDQLKERLEEYYHEIKRNFVQGKFEPSELNGGKFCEIVLRILEWHTDNTGSYTPLGTSIKNFGQSTRSFEGMSKFNDSIRFHIPQVLNALYPIRNKRGVAHAAGEIDPNYMDAIFVVSCTDWIMAELVRLFHNVSITEAQNIVTSLVTKRIPIIWQIGDHYRVISPPGKKLSTRDKVLLLSYNAYPETVSASNLLTWTEYDLRNRTRFLRSILGGLHKEDLIHFNTSSDDVHLSPLGVTYVEKNLPLSF